MSLLYVLYGLSLCPCSMCDMGVIVSLQCMIWVCHCVLAVCVIWVCHYVLTVCDMGVSLCVCSV